MIRHRIPANPRGAGRDCFKEDSIKEIIRRRVITGNIFTENVQPIINPIMRKAGHLFVELLKIFFTSIGSVIVLFILTKIIGNHQMSQLNMFDYINGITIGSIAAEMATSLENDFMKPLTAMMVYGAMSVLFTFATRKSTKLRRILAGETLVLYDNGKIYRKNLAKAKLDISELLTECRNSGYFNLAHIQTAVLEPNGKINFLPVSTQRPVIPQDLSLTPEQERLTVNVIMDGKVMADNLDYTGNNEIWLLTQLQGQGIKLEDVFLATWDSKNNLCVYVRVDQEMMRTLFE